MLQSIFGPASPDTQAAPILKQQEDMLNSKIPDVLNDSKPVESPTKLFQSYLQTGNQLFKEKSGQALDALSMFADKAGQTADYLSGTTRVDKEQQPLVDPYAIHKLTFSENSVPLANLADGTVKPIDQVKIAIDPHPLSSVSFSIPKGSKDGVEQFDKQVITDPEQLKVAGTIKAIADRVNPDYTNYLLKLGNNEGTLKADARNYNFKDGTASTSISDAVHHGGVDSVDRGPFQINSKAFPQITDAMADDPSFATLWAISLIDAGKQSKWMANDKSKKTKVSYE